MVFSTMKNSNENIPEKYSKMDKSFIAHLQGKSSETFMPFPRNTTFVGKDNDEQVILVTRRHWGAFLRQILLVIFLVILAIVSLLLAPKFLGSLLIGLALFLIIFLIALSIAMFTFLKWFFNVNIITDQRVVDIDIKALFTYQATEARLDKIEDITTKQVGLLSNFFNIGTVYIQTAGSKAEIEFDEVANPKEVQDILSDLLELKKGGEI
jgi:membrane protein YdbS with pleckstrin-like domain